MAEIARAGPGRRQEPRTPIKFSAWVANAKALGSSSIAFLGTLSGCWVSSGTARTGPSARVGSAVAGVRLNSCTTLLTTGELFLKNGIFYPDISHFAG